MNNKQNKPLTAEEMVNEKVDTAYMCDDGSVSHLAHLLEYGTPEIFRYVTAENAQHIAEQYAAQQLAAEAAALREELKDLEIAANHDVAELTGERDNLKDEVEGLREELEQLKDWKKSQIATFAPLLDFGQSKESGLRPGESIVQGAVKSMKEVRNLREQLADQTKQLAAERATRIDFQNQLTSVEKHCFQQRNELEAMKKERDQWKYAAEDAQRCHEERHIACCQAEKERDQLKGTATKSWVALNFERHEHKKCRDQRDEAVKLLREYGRVKSQLEETVWHRRYIDFLSRLSSGETKPSKPAHNIPAEYPGKEYQELFDHMNNEHDLILLDDDLYNIIEIVRRMGGPWISVEERLPEVGVKVLIAEWACDSDGQKVYNYTVGSYNGNKEGVPEFTGVEEEFPGSYWPSHWMPLPEPPESLTDKK